MGLKSWLGSLKTAKTQKTNNSDSFGQYKKRFNEIYGAVLPRLDEVGRRGLVSVVLPVYNGADYICGAVESVLAQTYRDFELIIVNDGSTDGSGEIARGYAEKCQNVKYIEFDRNRKLPAALNAGFEAAEGEFYTWISHDNIMLPEFLKIMTDELRKNQSAAMVYANMRIIDENGKIRRGHGWYELPPMSGNVMLPESTAELNDVPNNTVGAAFLYRAKAADFLGGYDEKRFGIEDYDYWMRMNEIFDIIHSEYKAPVYLYRFHKNSLTSRDAELRITADRPLLMAYDRERRRHILTGIEQGTVGELKNIIISC